MCMRGYTVWGPHICAVYPPPHSSLSPLLPPPSPSPPLHLSSLSPSSSSSLPAPLLTFLGSSSSELVYTCLQHVQLLLARQPELWSKDYQIFFCRSIISYRYLSCQAEYKVTSCPDSTLAERKRGSGYNTTSRPDPIEGRNQIPL